MQDGLSTTNPLLLVLSFLPGGLLGKWSSKFKDFTSVKFLPRVDIYLKGQALPSPRKIKTKNIYEMPLCQTLLSVRNTEVRGWVTPSGRAQQRAQGPRKHVTTRALPGGGSDDGPGEQEENHPSQGILLNRKGEAESDKQEQGCPGRKTTHLRHRGARKPGVLSSPQPRSC